MKKSTKRFLSAVGSILDVSPSGNYSEHRIVTSDVESIGTDWIEVGCYLKGAVAENEQKKIAPKHRYKAISSTC